MTSSLQIRATNAATQCEQTRVLSVYALLTSHFLFLYRANARNLLYLYTETQRFPFHFFSADLGQFTNNSTTWTVSLPAGWTVQLSLEDALLDEAWSDPVRIHTTLPPSAPPLLLQSTLFRLTAFLPLLLDRGSTEWQYQLFNLRPRCAPQRSLVSIKSTCPILPSLSGNRFIRHICFCFCPHSFPFIIP